MKLIFEKGTPGRHCHLLPDCDVPVHQIGVGRKEKLNLPELSENEISRHYTGLAGRAHGVNNGFYPLGSCTMKYNPKVNEEAASLEGFAGIHPLQPEHTVRGALRVFDLAEQYLCEITGMDAMTFREDGCVDLDKLKEAVGEDTAGLMLTNPNTVGLFDKNILEITRIVHDGGGLCYYDGANLNAVMGIVRPGDMGFDVIHLNLHKTFSTPHGGGGPGSGPVGCKEFLRPFLPGFMVKGPQSIGSVKMFYGNFGVVVKALAYIMTLGREGIPEASSNAVLNANYMMNKLSDLYQMAYNETCMHEFVMTLEDLKHDINVSAMDIAKALLDYGIHPPTMYFPLIVHEALMVEPTETESKETLDEAIEVFRSIYEKAKADPQSLHQAPVKTPVRRLDEVTAARKPVLRYIGE